MSKQWLKDFQTKVHAIAKSKGWHNKPKTDGEFIALMHSELSEGLEWLRNGNGQSDHIPEFLGIEEELADIIIRVLDYAEKRKLNVVDAMLAKAEFNITRDYKHGGKKF